jgi:hypothetical protein
MPADEPERFSVDMEFPTDEVKRSYRDALGSDVNIANSDHSNGTSNPQLSGRRFFTNRPTTRISRRSHPGGALSVRGT